jgi:hypothetical protein
MRREADKTDIPGAIYFYLGRPRSLQTPESVRADHELAGQQIAFGVGGHESVAIVLESEWNPHRNSFPFLPGKPKDSLEAATRPDCDGDRAGPYLSAAWSVANDLLHSAASLVLPVAS